MPGYLNTKEKKPFYFEGGAYDNFGRLIASNLKLTTWAVSERSARRNFEMQIRRMNDLIPATKIVLEGTIK